MRRLFSMSLLNNRFPALHGLRVLAIFGVLQLHATDAITHMSIGAQMGTMPKAWSHALSFNAWFSMDLFFILSGFLIGTILLRMLAKEPGQLGPAFSRFYFRRAFRTFPLYYVFLISFYLLDCVYPIRSSAVVTRWPSLSYKEFIYLTNYPFDVVKNLVYWSWSLSLEEHFYLLSPIVVFFLMKLPTHRSRLIALISLWSSGFIVRACIYGFFFQSTTLSFFAMSMLYTPTHARYDILVAGLFLAYLNFYFADETKRFLQRPLVNVFSWLIPLGILALILSPSINPTPLGLIDLAHPEYVRYTALTGILYYGTLTSIAYSCIILRCLYLGGRVNRWLCHPAFLTFATLGYGIYLVHIPVVYEVETIANRFLPDARHFFFIHWFTTTFVGMVLSALLAYILHILVEKPFLLLRDRFAA